HSEYGDALVRRRRAPDRFHVWNPLFRRRMLLRRRPRDLVCLVRCVLLQPAYWRLWWWLCHVLACRDLGTRTRRIGPVRLRRAADRCVRGSAPAHGVAFTSSPNASNPRQRGLFVSASQQAQILLSASSSVKRRIERPAGTISRCPATPSPSRSRCRR